MIKTFAKYDPSKYRTSSVDVDGTRRWISLDDEAQLRHARPVHTHGGAYIHSQRRFKAIGQVEQVRTWQLVVYKGVALTICRETFQGRDHADFSITFGKDAFDAAISTYQSSSVWNEL